MFFIPFVIGAGVVSLLSPTIRKEATDKVVETVGFVTEVVKEVFSGTPPNDKPKS